MLTMAICTTSKSCRSLGARLLQPISSPLWQPGDGTPFPRPSAHDGWSSAQLSRPGCTLTKGPRLLPHCRYWRHALLFSVPSTDQLHCADDKALGLLITQGSASQVSLEGCKCRCKPRDSPQLELGLPTLSPSSRPGSSLGPPEGCPPCVARLQVGAK